MAIKKPFKWVNQWNVKGISKWVDEVTEAVNAQEKQLDELDKVVNGNCESIDKQAARIEKLEKDTKLHYAGDDYARTST